MSVTTNIGATGATGAAKVSSVAQAEAAVIAEPAKVETFFEKNPKAIAIGSAIAGIILAFAVLHFL